MLLVIPDYDCFEAIFSSVGIIVMRKTKKHLLLSLSLKLIHIYQHIAPKAIRNLCRYQPTCSEYALLALEKYGFFKGWKKAIRRIIRCRFPHGGADYP